MIRALLLLCFFAVNSYAASDLEVQKVTTSSDPSQGILKVQIQYKNNGPASIEKPKCRLSLYSGQQVVDSLVYELNPINAGESSSDDLEWKMNAPAANSLQAEVFDENEPDDHPANNSWRIGLRIPGLSKTDLELADVILPEQEKLEGKSAELNVLVRNKGPVEVRSSTLKITLSQFQQQVAGTEKKIGKLQPSEEKQIKIVLRLPNEGIAVEQALLEIRYESTDQSVEEIEPANNSFSKPILVSIRMPDLAPRYVRVDSRGNVLFTVMNFGVAVAKETTTALYVNGSLVRRYTTPQLRSGNERRHLYGGTKIETGAKITVVADFNADLQESSEENNRMNYIASPPQRGTPLAPPR